LAALEIARTSQLTEGNETMRIRTLLFGAALAAATFVPLRGVTHASASNTTCRVTPSGGPTQPATVTFPLGDLFANESFQATAVCVSLSGETYTATVTAWVEYFKAATLTWVPTSCASITGQADSTNSNPPNVSNATAFASAGCVYHPGDPSLNALHRVHATVSTTNGAGDDETSAPWLIAGVGI
jgi:hypothetical protein